jgi:hypothetical protein
MQLSNRPNAGTATKVENLKVGDRILTGIDTKPVKSVTVKDGVVYVTTTLRSGNTGRHQWPAGRTVLTFP